MTYIPLVIRSEFKTYVNMSANIGTEDSLDMHIKDMQTLDFLSWCDTPLYNDLLGNLSSRPQLEELLNEYIKPYLICGAYESFLLWHGRNMAVGGIREFRADDQQEITDKARAELISNIRSKTNSYLNKLKYKLSSDNYTYDGVIYTFYDECDKKKSTPNIGIKQVGKSCNNYNYRHGY